MLYSFIKEYWSLWVPVNEFGLSVKLPGICYRSLFFLKQEPSSCTQGAEVESFQRGHTGRETSAFWIEPRVPDGDFQIAPKVLEVHYSFREVVTCCRCAELGFKKRDKKILTGAASFKGIILVLLRHKADMRIQITLPKP